MESEALVAGSDQAELEAVVGEALGVGDVASAVIFVASPHGDRLDLAAAAGIVGPPLDGLVAAVRNPAHPIVLTLADDGPTFDVLPINPGGPRLRSHLPLRAHGATVGVLALAHQSPTDDEQRARMKALAERAASAVG